MHLYRFIAKCKKLVYRARCFGKLSMTVRDAKLYLLPNHQYYSV